MRLLWLIMLVIITSCKDATQLDESVENTNTENRLAVSPLEIYDFEGLKPLLKTTSDSIYVVNFWATWCAPCIKEIPYFESINKIYKKDNVQVVLVSLDFPKKYDSHLKPFIAEHKLKSRVVVLNDTDSNTWIPEINPDWSGAIPATLIFNKSKRAFYEQPFSYEELEMELKKFMN